MKIANSVLELIGKTPLLKLEEGVFGKCEFLNPGGSVKDRIALNMIEEGIKKGLISENTTIIEPTSGNTGIGLASVCALKGIKLILTMPESMSVERRKLLQAYGAKIELTPASEGMKGAIEKAYELSENIPDSFIPQQFENSDNPDAHRKTTALEIWNDIDGKIDIFVAAVGTGGTLTGIGEVLKNKNPKIKVIAVEPIDSAVLSGEKAGPHKIQGIGAGFVPKILNKSVIDEVIKVSSVDAFETSRWLAKERGVLVGISAGANVWASLQISGREENKNKNIVTILCDTGERYLSTELFNI